MRLGDEVGANCTVLDLLSCLPVLTCLAGLAGGDGRGAGATDGQNHGAVQVYFR